MLLSGVEVRPYPRYGLLHDRLSRSATRSTPSANALALVGPASIFWSSVFVADKFEELLPRYLNFFRGVVD